MGTNDISEKAEGVARAVIDDGIQYLKAKPYPTAVF